MKRFNKEQIDDMIQMYKDGNTLLTIGNKYDIYKERIRKILTDNQITIRPRGKKLALGETAKNRRYALDENYFESIDAEHKAYWLGFFFADGCVTTRSRNGSERRVEGIELVTIMEDSYHLYHFRQCIKGEMPLGIKKLKHDGEITEYCRLSIACKKLANDLVAHGCVPKKSLILKEPLGLPIQYTGAFIRGYFDGDGCLTFRTGRTKGFMFEILGTHDFLSWVADRLKERNITCTISKRKNVYKLRVTRKDNLAKLYNFIYDDKEYFLDRKQVKFMKALRYYKMNIVETIGEYMFNLIDPDETIDDVKFWNTMHKLMDAGGVYRFVDGKYVRID